MRFGLPQDDFQAINVAHNVRLRYLLDSSVRLFPPKKIGPKIACML